MNTTAERTEPETLDVVAWRAFTTDENIRHLETLRDLSRLMGKGKGMFRSMLAFRQSFSPVDVYCYLKARFGPPNGHQNILRRDSSDNWIHWDYNLKSHDAHVYICGTYREIHVMTSDELDDAHWLELASRVKHDFARFAAQKKTVQDSLEKWVLFPNRYVEVATLCGDLHSSILATSRKLGPLRSTIFPVFGSNAETARRFGRLATILYAKSLELSLLTPVLAESFINMLILVLCKRDIRENARQFEGFIRSNIDVKVFDLAYKCDGFAKQVDGNTPEYKAFKKVMDRRNDTIHGNISPEKEQIEIIYFEKRRPLFKEQGDHLAKYFDSLSRRCDTDAVISDYENVHLFFAYLASLLRPDTRSGFWQVMESRFPGYDVNRKVAGVLLPEHTSVAATQGTRYDDELRPSASDPATD